MKKINCVEVLVLLSKRTNMKKYVDSFRKSDTNNVLEITKISPSKKIHVQNKQKKH